MRKVLHSIADYFSRTDKIFWLISLLTTIYGLILIYSVTRAGGNFFKTQVMAVTLGYIAAVVVSLMNYEFIAKLWPVIAGVCIGLILLTYFVGRNITGTDDTAWLTLPGGISFQPAELVKIGFIVTFAKHLSVLKEREKLHSFPQVCLLAAHALVPIVLVHFQGDDGTALVFVFMFLIMCFAAGIQLRYFFIVFAAAAAGIPLIWNMFMHDEQRSRFLALLDLDANSMGKGYQQYQGKISIASGELTGRGLFNGPRVDRSSVPFQENDFIFTVAGEELGFIGCVLILGVLLLLMLRALQNAASSKDALGKYICVGFFSMIATQTCINIGMVLGLIPVIGITLPFFSAGGSSVACLYLGVGLVESVYMHQYASDKVSLNLQARRNISVSRG